MAATIIPSESNQTEQAWFGPLQKKKKRRFLLYIAAPPLITVDAPSHWLPL